METRKHPLFANIGRTCFLFAWKCSSIVILCFMETCSNKGKRVKISDKSMVRDLFWYWLLMAPDIEAVIYDFMMVLIVKFMLSVKQSDGQESGNFSGLMHFQKGSILHLQWHKLLLLEELRILWPRSSSEVRWGQSWCNQLPGGIALSGHQRTLVVPGHGPGPGSWSVLLSITQHLQLCQSLVTVFKRILVLPWKSIYWTILSSCLNFL